MESGERTTENRQEGHGQSLLVAIPHYYPARAADSPDGRWHGSVGQDASRKKAAL
jgi:hypothetical protein